MGVKMSDDEFNKNNSTDKFGDLLKNEYAVILLQGRNAFGDMIYSYVEVTLPNIKRLYAALNSGEDFTPSDFGTIVAAGKGSPSEGLRKEMESSHNMMQPIAPAVFQGGSRAPVEKKAWDEY
jgi:hypothetical protein